MEATALLPELLQHRAEQDPDGVTFTVLDGFSGVYEWRENPLTNRVLFDRSRAVAAQIQRSAAPGDRVLIVNHPGVDYLVSLFGSLLAGTVAVPAYPMETTRLSRGAARIDAIVRDAAPRCVLTDAGETFTGMDAGTPITSADTLDPGLAERWRPVARSAGDLAVLQYTSGSTGTPKGVMLSYANIARNLAVMRDVYGLEGAMNGVFWLPPYHDMGLIGSIFMALFCGGEARLFAPLSFLRSPLRWMSAMSRYGATVTAAPDFAYELCAQAASAAPDEVAGLDLSGWNVAISGAEPVRARTMARFADAFTPAGFRPAAFHPSYGLAENTLVVTARPGGGAVRALASAALERHQVVAATPDGPSRDIVNCGPSADPDQVIAIVDAETTRACADRQVGEIWVSGASVAQGYWGKEPDSAGPFGVLLDGCADRRFLRTGDLGFLEDGELFVTGRLKDLVIVRGRNHYPQDIEDTVHEVVDRRGRTAAFSAPVEGVEELMVAVELPRSATADLPAVAAAVRDRVGAVHQVAVHEVFFLPRGGIQRTSSGKVKRSAIRDACLAGTAVARVAAARELTPPRDETERVIAAAWARVLGVAEVGVHDRFFALGGDSLKAVQLLEELNTTLDGTLSLSDIATLHTVAEFAAAVRSSAGASATAEVHLDLG